MNYKILFTYILTLFLFQKIIAQQRVVAECTVQYQIKIEDSSLQDEIQKAILQSSITVYIKGNDCRVDLMSPSYTQSVIYDKTFGSSVILREFGNNKFMTKMNSEEWKLANQQYEGLSIHLMNETKNILGYDCKKAILQLKDSSLINLYYATTIVPSVREFEYPFRDVPGFVLEFEIKEKGNDTVRYTATKINLSPVQASKYDIPTNGYRLLN